MYDEKGKMLSKLGDVARTFEQHANIRGNSSFSDEEIALFC